MPTRRSIADGYLDEVFAARVVEETPAGAPLVGDSSEARSRRSRGRTVRSDPRKRARTARAAKVSRDKAGDVSVALRKRQVDFVDAIVRILAEEGLRNVSRQQVVQALLDALDDSGIALLRVESLESLRNAVCASLQPHSLLQIPQVAAHAALKLLSPLTGGLIDFMRGTRGNY